MNYVVISTSLNENSHGRVLAREMEKRLATQGANVNFIDIQDYDLPMCGGKDCNEHPEVQKLMETIEQADGIIMAVPIYNYNVAASAKNFLELTGKAWQQKVVGLLCAAGGDMSYMAALPFVGGLLIDFRCIVVPRYVYASGSAFSEDHTKVTNEKIHERLDGLTNEFTVLAEALHGKISS